MRLRKPRVPGSIGQPNGHRTGYSRGLAAGRTTILSELLGGDLSLIRSSSLRDALEAERRIGHRGAAEERRRFWATAASRCGT